MAVKTVKATINGTQYTLTLNSSTGKYEAQITAPSKSSYTQSGHYYNVSLAVTDEAGNTSSADANNSTLGSSLRLVVKETTAPTIAITSPTQSQTMTTNKPTIKFNVTDNDSGVNPDTITCYVDGTAYTAITKTAITGGYSCQFTLPNALSDGAHTVYIVAEDYDGNSKTSDTISFKTDTTPPQLSVSSPANGLITNNSVVTVIGTTNDATSSPVTLTINGQSVTVGSDGSFTHNVTLSAGENTITIIATDAVGKQTTITRTVTLDTTPPVIGAVSISPNPVNVGKVFTISVTVTD